MSAPTTVRLSEHHRRLLDHIQTHRGASSRQEVFEALIEEEALREEVDVAALARSVAARDREALDALRDL